MSYVVDVGYALDLSQIGAAINKFKELQKEVDKTDKALNSMGKSAGSSSEAKRTKEVKDLGSAAESTSKKVKQVGEAAAQAGDKFDRLAERNKIALSFMTQGFTKGEATILATAKQAGALDKQIEAIGKSMVDIGRLTSNAFDNSQGSVRALEKELQTLKDRIELNAKGLNANAKQLREYSRAAEEVRATVKTMGVELSSTEGQKLYNKLLTERRQKLESLIRTSSELEAAEKKRQDQLKRAVQPRTSQQSQSDIYLSEMKVIEDVKRAVAAKEKAEQDSYSKATEAMRQYYLGLEKEDMRVRQQQQKSSDDLRKNFLKEQESNRKEYQKTMADMAAMYRQMEKEAARSSGSTGAPSPYERQLLVNKAINEELKVGVPYAVAKLKAEERVAKTYQETNSTLKEQIAIQKQIAAESRKVQGVERRANVRQTAQQFGVNLQDAAFILDAKATGNMQLYNKALESTRKTMLETIPVATTLKTLIPAIGAVGGVAFLAQATREFLKMADSMRLVEARINLVSTAGADASQVLDQLVEISKENRVNLDTTSRLYTRLVPAMESFKVNLEGTASATDAALKVTKAFGAALLISGANTQEAIAATTQFTQAMASGKLAGDEFRSVSEAAPAFLKAIADGGGYARSELKALSSEGKLTTELISQALLKMQSSLEAKAAKVPVTMGQAFERVKTDLMVFSRDLNESTGAVDGVVSAIETLGIVIQGLGSGLAMMKEAVDPLNDSLNGMGTSLGQLLFAASSVYALSKVLASVIGVAGIAGAATTAGGALVTATAAMRGYAAATAISIAATGTLSTALFAARGAVLTLGTALASTPIGVILAGAATAAGILYFNSEQAAVQISKLAEEKEGSIKSTKVLLESEEKLAKSWDELIKKAPEVGQAIQKSFDSSGVKFLTDDQQRELEESMKRIQKLREDVSKDNLSGRERVEKNELIIALKKEYDARYRTFALQQQIDMFNSTSDGAASDMIKKLQDEVKQREQVNKLLREGVSLRKAELLVAGMTAIQEQYGTPTIMPGEGPIQFEARKLSIKRQIAEQEAALRGEIGKLTTLEEEQDAILKSQKGSRKKKTNSLLEELQALEKLLPLAKQIGDVEKARLIAGGISAEQAQRLLDLRKQIQVLENAKSRKEETELVQKELELLKQGLTVEQTKAALEQDALKRAMIAKGYSVTQFEDRVKDLALIKELTEADKERQEAVQKLQETYAEFIAPEKLEIGDLFGDAAQGAGVLLNTMYDIAAQQEEIAKRKELINKSGLKGQALEKELMAIQKKQSANELSNMRAVAGGAKQLFKEKSTGYKVLERLEQAMFIMQLYNQKAEIAAFITGVATKVAGYATTALAAGKAAIASSLIAPPPANFASLAAVLAVLGGIGLAISGARGKGKDDAMPVYNEGKGTVLGDSNAQSESIKKSIEALEKYAKVELPITSAMLQSLRNIESGISGLGSLIVRSPNGTPGAVLSGNVAQGTNLSSTSMDVMTIGKVVGAVKTIGVLSEISSIISLFTSASGVGALVTIASALIPSVGKAVDKVIGTVVGGIFGKVSTKVIGSGLTANIQTMKDVLENGFELLEYVDIQTKKKSWFGSKSKVSTQTAQADAELSRQFSLIFENFYSTILLSAKPLGANLDVVTNLLDNFVIDIGKIQLGGKTGKEVQETLEAVFGQQADLMARFAFSSQESIRFILNEWVWFGEQMYEYGQQFTLEEFLTLPEDIQTKLKPVVESLKTPFDDFQRVGEGFFETITRVASGVERAQFAADTFRVEMIALSDVMNKQGDVAVELLRQSLIKAEKDTYGFATGVSDIVAIFDGSIDELEDMWEALTSVRENLRAAGKAFEDLSASMIKGARGFEELQNGLESFFEDFLSEGEQFDELMRQMAGEFNALGLVVPQTKDQFKALVQGIDTTTEAGQQLFGALVALSPEFDRLASLSAQMIKDAEAEVVSAYEREMAELDKIIKARDDAISELEKAYNAESSAIEKTISSLKALADRLRDFIKSINQSIIEESVVSNQTSFASFRQAISKVNGGDEKALDDALAIGNTLRNNIPETAASSAEMVIRLAELREEAKSALTAIELQMSVEELQLEQLKKSVSALLGLDRGVKTVAEAIAQLEKAEAAAQAAEAQKAILTEQLTALGLINQSVLSVAQAIANLAATRSQVGAQAQQQVVNSAKDMIAGVIAGAGAGAIVDSTIVNGSALTGTAAEINQIYQDILGRDADVTGLMHYAGSGMSIADIQASISSSYEAAAKSAGYQDIYNQLVNQGIASVDAANRYATGGVFTNSVVSTPTMFPMGLMGEAGPEAIMPLARGADGSLGVRSMVDSGVARGLEILAAKLETFITDNRAAQSAIATNTGKVARIIERADNGDSINIALVAD